METIEKRELGAVDKLHLNIELAENGIIIHREGCSNFMTLAVHGAGTRKPEGYGYDIDHSQEHQAIGRIIYNWLMNIVTPEHGEELLITNFDLDVRCKCQGIDE